MKETSELITRRINKLKLGFKPFGLQCIVYIHYCIMYFHVMPGHTPQNLTVTHAGTSKSPSCLAKQVLLFLGITENGKFLSMGF